MKQQHPGLMKVWKSPVLYFGVLLVLAVVGLLLAPFVVDWNSYRADLESYGKKLTGRSVTIQGPISARLFPWPRLTAEKVIIANPPGIAEPHFATAERITIRMTLASLAQGGIEVQSIEVEEPALMLERRATGEGNWVFTPSADLIRSDILSRVRLDQISLTGGSVSFSDRRRGETLRLDDVNATLASPAIAGPWRLRSAALYEDRPLDISVSSGSYVEGAPFRFGVKLAASDGSGYAFSFDGEAKDGRADGQIRIEPAASGEAKGDQEGRIRPLLVTARLQGDFDRIDFRDLEVSRLEPGHNGAITTGSATLRLGRHIEAAVDLKAAMLDLDALAGAQSLGVLRQAGSLGVASSLVGLLPADMSLSGKLEVTALKTGGQTLDNVQLDMAAERGQLRIGRFAAGLPGRSRALFTGLFAPGRSGPELNGKLALETNDLRDFTFWIWPDGRAHLAGLWTGSRGRLKLETDIGLTQSQTRLANADFELDGERGNGSLAVTTAGRGAIDLALEGSRFDLDAYAPQGIPTFAVAAREGAAGGLLALAMPRPDAPDLKLRFNAGELRLNAVTARDLSVDLESGANGLDLRGLEIGEVGGARVMATGLILDTGKGADGTVGMEIEADDPAGLIRLLGLAGSGGLPAWATGVGATEVRASLAVKPAEQGSAFHFRASGNAGEMNIAGQGTAAPDGALTGNLAVTAPSSARILSLIGLSSRAEDSEPGALRLEAAGTAAEGFMTTATLQAHGARLDYRGNAHPWAEGWGLDGQLSLRATEANVLAVAAGLPAEVAPGGLSGEARLVWGEGKWTLLDIAGRFGSQPFGGSASLTPALEAEARIDTGPLRLDDVVAATFLHWSGPQPGLEAGFASSLPLGLTGQFWLTPSVLEVTPHFAAQSAEIGIAAKPGEIQFTMYGKDNDGRDAKLELTSVGSAESRKLSGAFSLPVDLGRQLAMISGGQVAQGQGDVEMRFESEGRSPAGALAAVKGEGRFSIADFRLLSLTPAAFSTSLSEVKDAAGITAAFDQLRGGEGVPFGAVSGGIAIAEGQVSFDPIAHEDAEAAIEVKTMAELALGQLDIDIALKLKLREGLPPMSVSYAGPAGMLARAENKSELSTALGVTIMQQGIDELERLQQEQLRLAEIEDKQRLEDEARLQAHYAQRDELLLRRRELKVHGEMQVAAADRLRRQIETERAANAEINKAETRQRQRELRMWRRLARLSEKPRTAPAEQPVNASAETPAKPRPQRRKEPAGPVILANPPGAPVIISAPPGSAPSQ
jgi:hypothetical protein